MNKIIFTSLMLVFVGCAHTKMKQYDNAVVKICPPHLLGCANRIVVDGREYLVDTVSEEASSKYQEFTKSLRRQKRYEAGPLQVSGYATKELGHFPNPMAEFDVFKLSDLKLPEAK